MSFYLKLSILALSSLFISCATTKYNSKHKTPLHLKENSILGEYSTERYAKKNTRLEPADNKIMAQTMADYHFIIAEIASLQGKHKKATTHLKLASLYNPHVDIFYRLSYEHMELENIEQAIKIAKKALELSKNSGKTLALLGNLYAIKGNVDKAREMLLKALTQKEYTSLLYLSVLYEQQGSLKDAIETLQASLKHSPATSHIAHYKLGNLYLAYNPTLAKKHYFMAIEENWDFVQPVLGLYEIYKSEGKIDKAINVLSNFQSISNKNPEISLKLANLYLAQKRLPDAYEEFSFIYSTMPYDLTAPTKMGLILVEQKKYKEAIKIFNQILDIEPESDAIKFYLGAVYEELDLKIQAVSTFLEITKDSSHFEEAMLHAAHLSNVLGNKQQAILIMENTLKTHPTFTAKILYANLLGERGDYKKAISMLENTLLEFENNIELFYALGSLYDMAGDKNKTIQYMNKVINLEPNNVAALNYIAYTYSELSLNLNLAQRYAHKALKLSPNDGYIKDTLGWILYKKGRLKEAIVILESAYKLEPNESIIADHLADAYYKNNQINKAVVMYKKALEIETNEKLLANIRSKLSKIEESISAFNNPKNYKVISAN